MGISWNLARMMAIAHREGVPFGRSLTLGRAQWFVTPSQFRMLRRRYRLAGSTVLFDPWPRYSEPWFRFLGAESVDALDACSYEDANLVHDLNLPVPEQMHATYDVVVDCGTLEHVFNFPVALSSAMQLVKPGGTLFMVTPCNDMMGHGMIQVSPELIFSTFTPCNGYELQDVVLYLDPHHGGARAHLARWYRVKSPLMTRRRVGGVTRAPAYLLVRARRVSAIQPFTLWPQQSDYVAAWNATAPQTRSNSLSRLLPSRLARVLRSGIRGIRKAFAWTTSMLPVTSESIFTQPDVFQPIDP